MLSRRGHLVHGAIARDEYLGARLGIEPLTPEFTAEHVRTLARGRTAPVGTNITSGGAVSRPACNRFRTRSVITKL